MGDLRVGLVGTGHISKAHIEGWRPLGDVRLGGVFDVQREAAEACAQRFGIARVFDTYEECVDGCDVIDICTPPHTHRDLAVAVGDAGKHLLIEKPVVTSLADWELVREAFERGGGTIGVVHNLKYSLAVLEARELVARGAIGRPIRLHREFLTDPASDRMLGGRHWSHDLPGGRWFETLPHELYLTHSFLGPAQVESVSAIRTESAPSGTRADEVVVVLSAGEALASFHYSASCGANRRFLTLEGTRGSIQIDILSDAVVWRSSVDSRWRRAVGKLFMESVSDLARWIPDRARYFAARLTRSTPHSRLIEAFARHLTAGEPHPTPPEEVDFVIANCERIGRAIDARVEGRDETASG